MLRETGSIIRQNYGFYLVFLLILYGLPWIDVYLGGSNVGSSVATFMVCSYLMLLVQCAVLYEQDFRVLLRRDVSRIHNVRGFMFRCLAISMLSLVAFLILIIGLYVVRIAEVSNLFLMIIISAGVASFVISLVGTWLPASIYGRKTSISDAFTRGKDNFISVLWRMIVGLVGFIVISIFVMVISMSVAAFRSGRQVTDVMVDGSLEPPIVIGTLIAIALNLWSATYISVVLTRSYMAAEDVAHLERQRSEGLANL